jgi:Uma2 family endonuclease
MGRRHRHALRADRRASRRDGAADRGARHNRGQHCGCCPSETEASLPGRSRAGINPADRADTWYQADLVVTCALAERGARAIAEPKLIVEVLSLSTAAHDRGLKLADYRKIAEVEQILLVTSEDRHVEVWRRAEDGWKVQDLIGDAAIPLAIDGQPLPLAAVYEGVAL